MTTQPPRGNLSISTSKFPWWILLTVGILVMLAGVGLLLWPYAPVHMLVIFFGFGLIANGLAMLVRAQPSAATVIGGIVLIIGGVLTMVFSEFTRDAFVLITGVALLLIGVVWFIAGFRLEKSRVQTGMILQSVLAFLLGLVILIWPNFTVTIFAFLLGCITLIIGGILAVNAVKLRKLKIAVIHN